MSNTRWNVNPHHSVIKGFFRGKVNMTGQSPRSEREERKRRKKKERKKKYKKLK